jgi:hypothetical protein
MSELERRALKIASKPAVLSFPRKAAMRKERSFRIAGEEHKSTPLRTLPAQAQIAFS